MSPIIVLFLLALAIGIVYLLIRYKDSQENGLSEPEALPPTWGEGHKVFVEEKKTEVYAEVNAPGINLTSLRENVAKMYAEPVVEHGLPEPSFIPPMPEIKPAKKVRTPKDQKKVDIDLSTLKPPRAKKVKVEEQPAWPFPTGSKPQATPAVQDKNWPFPTGQDPEPVKRVTRGPARPFPKPTPDENISAVVKKPRAKRAPKAK